MTDSASRYLANLLEVRTGQQLVASRSWRIETALKPLIRDHDFGTLDKLMAALMAGRDPGLADAVVEALLNNETFFFRDRAVFQLLESEALERLRVARASARRLRIWCAGCSTGQEAYSLAMMFAEASARWAGWTIDIFGTDISADAIARAREGIFSQFEIQRGLPVQAMMRWFDQDGQNWRAKRDLVRRMRFRQQNLLDGDPATVKHDVILCRNVLLYFSGERRRAVFNALAAAVAPDGYLMLGAGETVIGQTDAFASDPDLRGLYRPAGLQDVRAA
ncbi:MAG: chemotaxis protein CheR [Sphingomonas sp. SCN 67-18]|uniref:CheR family methyltransferase n=1 Tax=uncultured Sphingomonas sp. TaxID=158754 RepID=UPI00086F631E|nr:protein-glutamate O-methyltransferase CheR [Sphingomonas sp. SCN 67-18]ODU21513.1 MAG: chemotaxis protein CheR [Sphingomonas sp. SCN 67-18]